MLGVDAHGGLLSVEFVLKRKHFPCQLVVIDFVFAILDRIADAVDGGVVYFRHITDLSFNLLNTFAARAQFDLIGDFGRFLSFAVVVLFAWYGVLFVA